MPVKNVRHRPLISTITSNGWQATIRQSGHPAPLSKHGQFESYSGITLKAAPFSGWQGDDLVG